MRFTVDIAEPVLEDLLRLTGETKRSPAVARAVEDFVRRQKLREFGRLIRQGAFEGAFHPGYDPDSSGDLMVAEDGAETSVASSPPAAQSSSITDHTDGPR